jgi:putative protein-disulfide isomerase
MKLYYFFDPLCGWSYGFHAVLKEIKAQFPECPVHMICGGMMSPRHEKIVGENGQFYLNLLPHLENKTGASFGNAYRKRLEKGDLFLSSLKPSMAVNIVNSLFPEHTFDFIKSLHEQMFIHGCDLQATEHIMKAAEACGMDGLEIAAEFTQVQWLDLAFRDFSLTAEMGITTFPTLIAASNQQLHLLANGYENYGTVEARLIEIRESVLAW